MLLVCFCTLGAGCGDASTAQTATDTGPPDAADAALDTRDIALPDIDADTMPDMDVPPIVSDCLIGPEGGFCEAGICELSVRPDTFDALTRLKLEERPAPPQLMPITMGGAVCALSTSGALPRQPVELAITYDPQDLPPAFLEREIEAYALTSTGPQVIGSDQVAPVDSVKVTVEGSLTVGLTVLPATPVYTGNVALEELALGDPASYLRNLSTYPFNAAFYDGQRLYVGNGPRLLIYNGIPRDPLAPPDVVLGRVDLLQDDVRPTAANFTYNVNAIWSDGERLAVAEGNRILIWNSVPSESYTPANIVLGQESFNTNARNNGAENPEATTLFGVDEITSDGERFIVADTQNHRFLVWDTFPTINNQPADHVIGQEDMNTDERLDGVLPLYQPRGVRLEEDDRLVASSTYGDPTLYFFETVPNVNNPLPDWTFGEGTSPQIDGDTFPGIIGMSGYGEQGLSVRGVTGRRVSVWRESPDGPTPPDFVIGKPELTVGGAPGGPTASMIVSRRFENGVFADDQVMLVPDEFRLLIWETLPEYTFEPADLVIGQPSFATNNHRIDYRGLGRETLSHPVGAAAGGGWVAVADKGNNRVLLVDEANFHTGNTTGQGEIVVVGQPTGEAFVPDLDWQQPSAAALDAPWDAYTDGERLIVADTGNHRVLIWNTLPTSDGQPADLVLGQQDFTASQPNGGNGDLDGDGDADADASSFFSPSSVWLDGDTLYVSDTYNHRILVWDGMPTESGAPADRVIGQASFSDNEANRGAGWYSPVSDGMARPEGVRVEGDDLLIADTENNRVLIFDKRAGAFESARYAVGQPSLTVNQAPTYYPPSTNIGVRLPEYQIEADATTLRRPSDMLVHDGQLFVADTANHRVTVYDWPLPPTMPVAADRILGQLDPEDDEPDPNGVGPDTLEGPSGLAIVRGQLMVSDCHNHRLLRYPEDGLEASSVFGQPDLRSDGINGSAPAAGLLDDPRGVAQDGQTIWVADRNHNRVVALRDDAIVLALGQVNTSKALPNAGFDPSDWTLEAPSDVYTNGEFLAVADSNNHRVLIWTTMPEENGAPADIVIGQPNMSSVEPNAGRGATHPDADTLFAPEGVYYDGQRLYIADTGNNRVLVYDSLPERNGAAANRVLCQDSARSNMPNQGLAEPAADTCVGPDAVLRVDDKLIVTDSINNRVLFYDAQTLSTGMDAHLVIGQASFTTREASPPDRAPGPHRLSQPNGLAYDGVNLYIADRGNNRVLIYSGLPESNGEPADSVIGQTNFDSSLTSYEPQRLAAPAGLIVSTDPYNASTLLVADSGKDRIAVYERIARDLEPNEDLDPRPEL